MIGTLKIEMGIGGDHYFLLTVDGSKIDLRNKDDVPIDLALLTNDAAALRLSLIRCDLEVDGAVITRRFIPGANVQVWEPVKAVG